MAGKKPIKASDEVPFGIEEIFFSRTDERGVIASGNEVFQRVSGYTWEDLHNAPHKKVRHDDMPKSVFHLFWDRLKGGMPIVAYVKNRAADGRHYWVLAFASPAEGGYMSVRIKPSSELFLKAKALYAALLEEENANGWRAEVDGHTRLLEMLAEHGFENYEDFASQAAIAEITARANARGRNVDPAYANLREVAQTVRELTPKVATLADIFQRIRTTPVNLGIMANRIERAGGPISAISGIYSSMSVEISDWLDGFLESSEAAFTRMEKRAGDCLTVVAAADLQDEMLTIFEREAFDHSFFNRYDEGARLKTQSRRSARRSRHAIASIRNDAIDLQNAVHVLKRHVMSLSSTRVLCEIESAKLPKRSDSLEGVVAQLANFQDEIETLHKDIEAMTQSVISALTTNSDADAETEEEGGSEGKPAAKAEKPKAMGDAKPEGEAVAEDETADRGAPDAEPTEGAEAPREAEAAA